MRVPAPARVEVWIEAARPRTLPAALAPVIVGTAAADRFIAWRVLAALVVALALQVGVNYANDYFDGVRGVDAPERTGPRRAVASGLVAPGAMKKATAVAFGIAGLAGAALALAVQPWLILVGAACFAAALGYSGGPKPYGAAGLGEVAVFVFFGLVATVGTGYVLDERIAALHLAAAVPVGLLATAILVANNFRDIATDAPAKKHTLAVRLGRARTRTLHRALIALAYAWLPVVAAVASSPWPLVAFVSAGAAVGPWRAVGAASGPALIPVLAATARLELAFAVSLAFGLWIS